jgi:molybdenum cofactor cytidylyltransferase
MWFGELAIDEATGTSLAHSIRGPGTMFRKGRKLSDEDIAALRSAGIERVIVTRLEQGDMAEDEAAARLAAVAAGAGTSVAKPFTGRANLHADTRGVLVIDEQRIHRFNLLDEAITFATLQPYAVVDPKEMVATVKIIPFAAPILAVERCLDMLKEGPLVRVAPFNPWRCRLIQTALEGTSAKMLDKTVRVTADRVTRVGGELAGETRCAHRVEALAPAIREAEAAGFDILLIAGASAITDRRDVLPAGVVAAGGVIDHFGMPVDPGNLLLLARLGGRRVLGLPGCCRSPRLNGFDWVLERLAAGIEVWSEDVMRMGIGGLLMEIASRPQPREGTPAARATPPKVAAVVLAAGQSRRMGGPNKLLAEVDGKPLVRHAVDAALAAQTAQVVVVVGHQQHEVRKALRGCKVHFVTNDAFAEGLSTSLKAGIGALAADVDGAVVCLGDMPRISAAHIDRMIAAFNPIEGRTVVVATAKGKRGNPVLWGRAHFHEFADLAGDVGARHLIGQHGEQAVEVALEDGASQLDVDTPEALAALTGAPA